MSEENIFSSAPAVPTATPPVVTPPTTPQLPPEVAEFVGAGKKYATMDDALKSVPHAQKHIATIEAELANMKAELEKRKSAEAVLEEIKQSGFKNEPATPAVTVKPEDVQKMVVETLSAQAVQAQRVQNTNVVKDAFTAKFGQQAEAEYIKLAQDTGLSIADLNTLVATSPSAVIKLAGLDKQVPVDPKKPTSTVNTSGFQGTPQDSNQLSAKVKNQHSTKDLVSAWRNAGLKVGKQS